jgi:hypothetical protein
MMAQVKPRLIIPTHVSSQAAQYAPTLWPRMYSEKPSVKIGPQVLTAETRLLFLGILAPGYTEWANARLVDW